LAIGIADLEFNGQVFLLTCVLTDRGKARAPVWNYCYCDK